MGNFVCVKCGYQFESQSNSFDRRCPFCGEGRVKPEQDASSLIDDVDSEK